MSIEILLHPEDYSESDIQEAIKDLWPAIFPEYRLLTRKQIGEDMPSSWLPDLIARKPDDFSDKGGEYLLIELKGRPPAGSKAEAIAQIVGYAKTLRERLKAWPIRLLVIGTYQLKTENHYIIEEFEVDGFSGGVIRVQMIGERLLLFAEASLKWLCSNPLLGARDGDARLVKTTGWGGPLGVLGLLVAGNYIPLNDVLMEEERQQTP